MLEFLCILLPVVAVYGFYMGRASAANKRQSDKTSRNKDYLKGVDYLFTNHKDKAVDRFIAYLNAADPTFETRIALGKLLRQRGEINKAILLHQSIIHGQGVEPSDYELALLELAEDFMSSGIFDRAEQLLTELVEIPRQRHVAARMLVTVYEKERDFPKAVETALKYREELGSNGETLLAEYYCEMADQAAKTGKDADALMLWDQALSLSPQSVRILIEQARFYIRGQDLARARALIEVTMERDPSYGLLYLDLLRQCYPAPHTAEYARALANLVQHTGSAAAMVEHALVVSELEGNAAAETLILDYIKRNPSMKLISGLLGLTGQAGSGHITESLTRLKELLDRQIAQHPRYSCKSCGFEAQMLFWQCPSCRRWETMQPITGLDGD